MHHKFALLTESTCGVDRWIAKRTPEGWQLIYTNDENNKWVSWTPHEKYEHQQIRKNFDQFLKITGLILKKGLTEREVFLELL